MNLPVGHRTVYAVILFFLVFCSTTENPFTNSENIGISLMVAGDSGTVFQPIGDSLNLEIHLKLADLVASVIVDWNSSAEARDTIKVATKKIEDTIIVKHVFSSEGERVIRASAIPASSRMQKTAEMMLRIGRRPALGGNGHVLVPDIQRPGSAFFLAVAATGSDTLRYTWYRNGIFFPGANRDTISFDSVTTANAGDYFCIVSNAWGVDTSDIYHLRDTLIINSPVRIAVTSPLMRSDSAVVRTSLLAIGGTASSDAGIASVTVSVNSLQVPVVGTQSWAFAVSELAPGKWNSLNIMARDQNNTDNTLSVFLFFMPNLPTPSTPIIKQHECTHIDLE